MDPLASDPESIWDSILSRQPELIQLAYNQLSPDGKKAVLDHLKKMSQDPGWHPEQNISARAALNALKTSDANDEDQ